MRGRDRGGRPPRRAVHLLLTALLALAAGCGGGGGGGGGGTVLAALAPHLEVEGANGPVAVAPAARANLLLQVVASGRVRLPAGPVRVRAVPGRGAPPGWWGLLEVGPEGHRVLAERVGRATALAAELPGGEAGREATLLLVRARTGAEIREARRHAPQRARAQTIGGEVGRYLRDRVKNAIGLLHQPWELLDELYDDTEDKVVDIYSDALDSIIEPVLTDSDDFARTLDHWLTTSLSADPLGRGPLRPEQVPVVYVHGITFRYPAVDPGEELDDLMEMVAAGLPDWEARFHALRFEYNPFDPVGQAADELVEALVNDLALPAGTPLVLVGYSLGGIVARAFDSRYGDLYPVVRLIMIGSPNGGAPMDEIRDILLDRAYEVGNWAEVAVPLGLFARTLFQVAWARTYGSASSLHDIEVGSPFLDSLAPPRDTYYAIAGVKVGGNLLLRRVRRVYHGEPNDGVVSVASVEAGLPPGRDARITFPDGHRDYVPSSHGDLADSPLVAAEVVRILEGLP
ncbi:MAG: hypothetical protein D6739_02990 [Nitrospirae bacterium]|nr:MAG: hypothetical protein D6739_02990 [Nitrospirota bacterium]